MQFQRLVQARPRRPGRRNSLHVGREYAPPAECAVMPDEVKKAQGASPQEVKKAQDASPQEAKKLQGASPQEAKKLQGASPQEVKKAQDAKIPDAKLPSDAMQEEAKHLQEEKGCVQRPLFAEKAPAARRR